MIDVKFTPENIKVDLESLNNNSSISELWKLVESQLSEDYFVKSLDLDQVTYNITNQSIHKNKIKQYTSIIFSIGDREALYSESLNTAELYLDQIIKKCHEMSEAYIQQKQDIMITRFSDIINDLNLFIRLMKGLLHNRKDIDNRILKNIYPMEVTLLTILEHLLKAQQLKDYTNTFDLIKYELVPNLDQWKTEVLPLFHPKS